MGTGRGKIIMLMVGIAVIYVVLFYLIIPFLFDFFKIPVEKFQTHFMTVTILFPSSGFLVAISFMIPYAAIREILRGISYIILFFSLLFTIFMLILASPFIKRAEIPIEKCVNEILPVKIRGARGALDIIAYVSCIFTGYYSPDIGNLTVAIFLIFHIILPFAFIFSFIWGLTTSKEGFDLSSVLGKAPASVIVFVISLYALRVFFSSVLLDFLGYGVWGLVGVFGAFLLTTWFKRIVEGIFRHEEFTRTLTDAIIDKIERRRMFIRVLEPYMKEMIDKVSKSDIQAQDIYSFVEERISQIRQQLLAAKVQDLLDVDILRDIEGRLYAALNSLRVKNKEEFIKQLEIILKLYG